MWTSDRVSYSEPQVTRSLLQRIKVTGIMPDDRFCSPLMHRDQQHGLKHCMHLVALELEKWKKEAG